MLNSREKALRKALFAPCKTQDHLHRWIKTYLGIDMPGVVICDDLDEPNPSNTSPMGLIWEIYQTAMDGQDPDKTQFLGYSAREGGKTLSAAIIETLCVLHLNRSVAHMAALEIQARNCQVYVENFFKRPLLKEFITSKNKRTIEITRYESQDGEIISPVQYSALSPLERDRFDEKTNFIQIVIATAEAANGLHAPFMVCVDGNTELRCRRKQDKNQDIWPASRLFKRLAGLKSNYKIKGTMSVQGVKDDMETISLNIKEKTFEYKKITAAKVSWKDRVKLYFNDNTFLICTKDHPILVDPLIGKFVKAQDLQLDCEVIKTNQWNDYSPYVVKLKKIEEIAPDWVYDFTVEDNHNFIANGILVGNCDELDLADPIAVEEGKMIPSEFKMNGKNYLPITFYTSTRKYSFGLVQKEIDNADKTGLQVRHWNIIDVTQACPPERHLPDEPKIKVFFSKDNLSTISEQAYNELTDKEKEQYQSEETHYGCLHKCKIYAACRGRLAYKQTSNSPFLKSIFHTQSTMLKVSVETAKAQYLTWKPSTEGLVYPNFSKNKHMLTAQQMAEKITGEEFDKNFSKKQLIDLLQEMGAQFVCGLDWGFTHNFSVVTGALIGHILYVIDVINVTGLELPEKIDLCNNKLKPLNPSIYPDSAYPSDIKSFRKAGFRMVNFQKDILGGIDATRTRLQPGVGAPPCIFFLKGDANVQILCHYITQYHWKMDQKTGALTDVPDQKEGADVLDALRYLCQNTPVDKNSLEIVTGNQFKKQTYNHLYKIDPNKELMRNKLNELTGGDSNQTIVTGKDGKVIFTS